MITSGQNFFAERLECGSESIKGRSHLKALLGWALPALILLTLSCSQEQERSIRLPSQRPAAVASESEVGVGDLYAVVVGVANYNHSKIPSLKFSDKDARDFADFLKSQKDLFRNINLTLLVNEQATQKEVKKQLFYELKRAGKNDTVILFMAGHGADDPNMPGEFFFLTHDADPDFLEATAVNMGRSWFMQRLDSKRVLVVADTCHAGGFSKDGARSGEASLKKLMNQFKESEGRVFLTSSRPDEISKEEASLRNGVFTHYLLEGLKGKAAKNQDGVVTLQEAYEYVYDKTKNATNGGQHPQLEGRVVGKFPLALAALRPASPVGTTDVQPTAPPKPEKQRMTKLEKPSPPIAPTPKIEAIPVKPQPSKQVETSQPAPGLTAAFVDLHKFRSLVKNRNVPGNDDEAFNREVSKIIGTIRRDNDYTLILNSAAMISGADDLDITDQVASMYDASGKPSHRSGTVGKESKRSRPVTVAFVDFQNFAAKSVRAKESQKKFMEFVNAKRTALQNKKKEWDLVAEQLKRQGSRLSEEARHAKIKELAIKEMELKLDEKEATNAVEEKQHELQERFMADMRNIIGALRRDHQFAFILNSASLLAAESNLEITDKVARIYDGSEKSSPNAPVERMLHQSNSLDASKVAFVDFRRFSTKSSRANEQSKRFAEVMDRKRADLKAKKKDLESVQEQFEQQSPRLKREGKDAKIKELGIKELELKLAVKEAQNAMEKEQREFLENFRRDIVKTVANFRQNHKYMLILDAEALQAASDALEVTDKVAKLYDAQK